MNVHLKGIKADSFMGGLMKAASAVTAAERARVLRKMTEATSITPVPREIAGCKQCVDRLSKGPEAITPSGTYYPPPLIDTDILK